MQRGKPGKLLTLAHAEAMPPAPAGNGSTLPELLRDPHERGRIALLILLLALTAECAVTQSATLAAGDGANDLPMLEAAGLGIAFRAKPAVAAAARWRIDHADLTALLYAQGYRKREIRWLADRATITDRHPGEGRDPRFNRLYS